jgi:excisionase family DNA binding protein
MQHNAKPSNEEGLLKKPDVCQKLVFSRRTLDYRIKDGTIPYIKIGGAVRFLRSDIDALIKSHRFGGASKSTKGRLVK